MLVTVGVVNVLHEHILVKGVVLWRGYLLRYRIVERGGQLHFLGQELAKLDVGCDAVLLVVVQPALAHTLVKAAEPGSLYMSRHGQ